MESPATRRKIMQAVKSKDTGIEVYVRRVLHAQGYRFRLHRSDLPGCPDIVFVAKKKVIFVNGCFWHGHTCPRGARQPKNNAEYWRNKIARNKKRDRECIRQLHTLEWDVLVVWECQLKSEKRLIARLRRFLA